jgi:hypothetical protein
MTQEQEHGPTGVPVSASELESDRATNFASLYAGTVRIWVSPFEFVFAFGHIEAGVQRNAVPRLIEVGQVIMSPQHAKALSRVLAGRVRIYEQQYGEIPESQLGSILVRDEQEKSPPTES